MATAETAGQSREPSQEDLVRHLVLCMEQAGFTIEATDASGFAKPRQVKRFGLRPGRFRPDVVARDGRRTVFGEARSGAEISDKQTSERLETLARHCRLLVICLPEEVADEAIDTLFLKAHLPHWHKMRVLRYPRATWQELPRGAGRKGPPGGG
jgi:hypothetical protein